MRKEIRNGDATCSYNNRMCRVELILKGIDTKFTNLTYKIHEFEVGEHSEVGALEVTIFFLI